ncbi:hypothetical protein [Amycolatopsis sp. H20-H5]|uniref:hypothetical protein n=1 Tax=Amycolatopsis sp. H20-H5 TaxID=3046309 RepID=UPI002DB6D2C8|nr:hypothetical protein [Amycolatopsis sp. H20-H5]MEC3975670.1 hypothetical protein [Amycolatopsis sp. H20-H5]
MTALNAVMVAFRGNRIGLLVNPLLLSSVGLEVALGAAGVLWVLVYSVERRPVALGVAVGLFALIRLDLVLIALVVFLARQGFWEGIWRTAFSALAAMLPWFAFSWFVLGSAVPDTLVIKMMRHSWGPFSFTNGPLLYWHNFPAAATVSFLPLLAGSVLGLLWTFQYLRGSERAKELLPFAALAFAGALHYVAYCWLKVPPYHWYYAPSITGATILLAAGVAAVPSRVRVAAVTLAGGLLAASVAVYAFPGLPRQFAPISSNHASSHVYREIGTQLAAMTRGHTVESVGEVGALAYSCDCNLVDQAIADTKNRSGELGRALLEANFRYFDHSVEPATPDLVLATTRTTPPVSALASWTISSPWTGTQQPYLVPANAPR